MKPDDAPAPIVGLGQKFASGEILGNHSHRRDQVLYPLRGVIEMQTPEGRWVLPPHRALWIPRNTEHSLFCRQESEVYAVYLSASELALRPRKSDVLDVSPLLRELILEACGLPWNYLEESYESQLMRFLYVTLSRAPREPMHLPFPVDRRARTFAQYVIENGLASFDVDSICELAGLSRRTLSRVYKRETSMTVNQWLQLYRMHEAAALLVSGCSVQDISHQLGYNSPSSFSVAFRTFFGKSPREYRGVGKPKTAS